MPKTFGLQMDCIKEVLRDISWKYKDKKYFLDVGCGDGTRTVIFDEFGRVVCGIDYLDWLDKRVRYRIQFKQWDFMKACLPYKEESFDLLLCFDVIEHLYNPEVLLKEIYRLLKKDGVLIISTPNRNRLFGYLLQILGLRKFPYGEKKSDDPYAQHVIEYLVPELKNLLNIEGFMVKKCHKVFYGITGSMGISSFLNLPFYHNIIMECQKQ